MNASSTPSSTTKRAITRERFRLLATIEHALEKPLAVLGFVWLGLIIVSFVWGTNAAIATFTSVVWGIFIADFLIRIVLAPNKVRFLKRNVLMLIALIVPALGFLRVVPALATMPSWEIGLVRLLAALNRGIRGLGATLKRRGFAYVVALTTIVTFVGAAGIDAFEQGVFRNYGYSLWWTAMVMTTTGPDRYPHTTPGRLVMWAVTIFAFTVFGYLTATIASYFVNSDASNPESDVADEATIRKVLDEVRALRRQLT